MTVTTKEDRIQSITSAITRGGGILKFCDAVGVSHQAVYAWRKRGCVPPAKALQIEALFGIPRAALISPELVALLQPQQTDADVI